MKRFTKVISLALAFVLCCSLSVGAYATVLSDKKTLPDDTKISDTLKEKLQTANGKQVPTIIWLADADLSSTEAQALNAVNAAKRDGQLYFSSSDIYNTENAEEIQKYIEAKRRASEKIYTLHNQQIADQFPDTVDITYISRYSPVIVANLNREDALTLSKKNYVMELEYCEPLEFRAEEYEAGTRAVADLSTLKSIIRADEVHNSVLFGYTGEGVKIGILDDSLPMEGTGTFSHLSICGTFGEFEVALYAHMEYVLHIVSAVAPAASYYLAGVGNPTNPYSKFISLIEDLLSAGANVILASMDLQNDGYNQYGTMAKWLDHVAYHHNVHFVQSSGNDGSMGVTSGGMAYNIITVGNMDTKDSTTYMDDEICTEPNDESSYYTGSALAYKPDICAPGTRIRIFGPFNTLEKTGTSFSAPQVAGAIALLCEQMPSLLEKPAAAKAILTAAVNSANHVYKPSEPGYRQYGAGLLDCASACLVAGNGFFLSDEIPSGTTRKTHTFWVDAATESVRVSLAFNVKAVPVNIGDDDHDLISVGTIPNVDLEILTPQGQLLQTAVSATTNSNVEIVSFLPTMAGTYTIRVKCNSHSDPIKYGLAWRLE